MLFAGNGKIDFPEFVNMMVLQGDQMAWKEKDLKEAFRTFDSDDKGFMHAAELKYVLMRMDDPTLSDEDIKEMLDDTGLNINRKITFKGIYFIELLLRPVEERCSMPIVDQAENRGGVPRWRNLWKLIDLVNFGVLSSKI